MSNIRKDIIARLGSLQPKTKMGRAEKVMTDGSVHLDFKEAKEWLSSVSDDSLKYIISDANAAAKAMGSDGKKFNYYTDLALTAGQILRSTKRGGHRLNNSRPGAKALFGTDSISVNKSAKSIISKLKKITPDDREEPSFGLEQFHKRLLARMNEVVKSTDEAIRNPNNANLQWTMQDLKDVIRDETGDSRTLNRWASVWLSSRPGVKVKMGSSQVNDSATTADLIREAQRLRDVIKTSNREFDKTHLRQIKQELDKRGVLMPYGASEVLASRPGVKAKFAKWESTLTKKHGKPIEEYTARLKGGLFMIEVAEGTDGPYAVLYRWDDLRGAQRIASGNLQSLMRQAESMGAKEARGVAAIERISNYSRPGAKAK